MTQVTTGLFKNVASQPFFIPLHQYVSEVRLKNLTMSGITAGGVSGSLTSDRIVEAFWCDYMTSGTAQIIQNGTVSGILAPMQNGVAAINGISIFNAASQNLSAPKAITAFTPGTTTAWASVAHGFVVGDTVRVYGLTSAPQFGGLLMTVTAASANSFTTLLDSTGATTSVGFAVKVGNYLLPNRSLYYPQNRVIAKITNANPMVVTTLVQQNYYAGDVVTFDIPSVFGIPQLTNSITGLPFQATVISANNALGVQTVTVAVDSTSFGVFATTGNPTTTNATHWPLAGAYPFSFPVMVPQGEGNINNLSSFGVLPAPLPYGNQDVLSFARQNQASNGIIVGAGDGTNSATTGGLIGATADVWEFRVISSLQEYPQPLTIQYV
jgi:hypothetical protein